jgi:c(7)-type cytochrome triheme protein
MNSRNYPKGLLAVLLATLLMAASAVYASEAEKAEEAAPVRPRQEVLKSLPCFECHAVEDYLRAPEEGVFSHELHGMMSDLHCNQCHSIKGHETPKLKGEVCGNCHSTGTMVYSGGGMGKVSFNHEAHGAMFNCGNCHPDSFSMKKGGVKMKMTPMYQGKLCGSCHNGQMAFASQDCKKCHRG